MMRVIDVMYRGVALTAHVEYDPGEPMTFDHPGCPAEAIVTSIYAGTVDIQPMFSAQQVSDIESLVIVAIES